MTIAVTEAPVTYKFRAGEQGERSAAAFDQLANVIRSTPDHEPVKEKISVRHLNFFYQDGNQALRDLSVPIYANRVTAFIGPSGCGKSTLLRVFNRIYSLYPGQHADGEVLLDGEDILSRNLDVAVLRTRIGMVFQKPTPFPMSIYDNIAFGIGLNRRLTNAQMDTEVEVALRRAALWDEMKDELLKIGLELSGGQQDVEGFALAAGHLSAVRLSSLRNDALTRLLLRAAPVPAWPPTILTFQRARYPRIACWLVERIVPKREEDDVVVD